jgi:TRAP-type transport system periplasmic protein
MITGGKTMTKTTKITLLAATAALAMMTGTANAQFSERTIRISNGVTADHPIGNGLTKMTACLAEKSGGKMKLQSFWGSALGGDLQATTALRSGTQEMVVTSTSPLVGMMPELGVFDLPFLFANEKEADAILDGEYGKYISSKLPAIGLINISWWENGFRNLTNSKKPVEKLEDFPGLKVRVMQNNIFLDTFKTVGANAVPMAFQEVFAALETKAIDGQENPFVTISNMKLWEVQKYLSITNHAYTPFMILYSKALFDKLSAEEQKALYDCGAVGQAEQRAVTRAQGTSALENVKKQGMQVNVLSSEQQARLREAVKPVYERTSVIVGKETVERVQAELAKIRK